MYKLELYFDDNDKNFYEDVEDRFQDFFSRLLADIQENSFVVYGNYETETAALLKKKFNDGALKVISDDEVYEITEELLHRILYQYYPSISHKTATRIIKDIQNASEKN